jgi:hypothetical protein
MDRGSFSILIIMIWHGYGWAGTNSTETFLQVQFLDSKSNGHRYFNMRIQERKIQYVYKGQTIIIKVVQGQHGDLQ